MDWHALTTATPDAWLAFAGRFHPLLLHLPLALLPVLALLELLAWLRRRPMPLGTRRLLAAIAGVGAVATAASGWQLSGETGYGGDTLEWHRWAGVTLAALAMLVALASLLRGGRLYARLLTLALLVLLPTGHLGAGMTHGTDFLWEPFSARGAARDATTASAIAAAATAADTIDATPTAASPAAATLVAEDATATGSAAIGAPHLDSPAYADQSAPDSAADGAQRSAAREATATDAAGGSDHYATVIAPLLAARCSRCHGESRHKGGLSLHAPEAILAGGEHGAVITPGDPDRSELLRRLALPLEHDDHMPPAGKPQPGADEIAAITAWIAAGAPFGDAGDAGLTHDHVAATVDAVDALQPALAPPAEALAALAAARVHVELLDPAHGLLWVSFAPRPDADDALVAALLPAVGDAVAELSLAGTRAGDASVTLAARLPRLQSLDLSRTAVTAAGLSALATAPSLHTLDLAGTALAPTAIDALAAVPTLQRVTLWNTGLADGDVARLAAARPALVVTADAAPPVQPLEIEPEVALVEYQPPPAADLAPVNRVCPVSGAPVDPAFLVVHEGQVIGFCCHECPSRFWADPAAFPIQK